MLFAGCQTRRGEDNKLWSLTPLPGLFVSCVYKAYLRGSICHRPRETRDPEDTESLYPEEPPSTRGGGEAARRTSDLNITVKVKRCHLDSSAIRFSECIGFDKCSTDSQSPFCIQDHFLWWWLLHRWHPSTLVGPCWWVFRGQLSMLNRQQSPSVRVITLTAQLSESVHERMNRKEEGEAPWVCRCSLQDFFSSSTSFPVDTYSCRSEWEWCENNIY